jgi:histidine phosphotransferase ChpT
MVDDAASDTRPANSLRLAELLTARLCHDLSGALGTVVGALEMADEDPSMAADALPVAGDASRQLSARLRLLRAAWGDGMGGMHVPELIALLQGLPHGRKLRIDTAALEPNLAFAASGARLLLNVMMVAAESLPRGGQLTLAGSPAGKIVLTIQGPGAAWPAGFAAYLTEESKAWDAITDARRLQAPLTALIAWSYAMPVAIMLPTGEETDMPPPLTMDLSHTE